MERVTELSIIGISELLDSFTEILDCSLSAFFMWIILERLPLFGLELHHKGKDRSCKKVVCVSSQVIPDSRECQNASKDFPLRENSPLGNYCTSESTILCFVVVCLFGV